VTHRPRIVFAGAGHASLVALKALGPLKADITLLSDGPFARYSGMMPGFLEGLYDERALSVPLAPFAERVGARFIEAHLTGATDTHVLTDTGAPLPYDILVLAIGSVTAPVPGAAAVVPGRPFGALSAGIAGRLDAAASITILGAGAAGAEVALALRRRRPDAAITIVERGPEALGGFPAAFRRRVTHRLGRAGIPVLTGAAIASAGPEGLALADGRTLPAALTLAFTGPVPPPVLDAMPFARAPDGFLATDRAMRVLSHPNVLAAGDIATMVDDPRPKAGVFAVRAGKPLARAVLALLAGTPPAPVRLQRRGLVLLSTGGRRAIGLRNGIVAEGALVWRLKDRIDRAFIASLGGGA